MREYILREILVLGVVVCFIEASVSVVATGGVNDFKSGMDHWFISKYHGFRLSDVSHRLYTHRLSYSMDTSILDAPVEEWNKTFGGKEDDYGGIVKQTTDGGYIIVGYTRSNSGNKDIWLIKTDNAGNMIWNKTFGGKYDDTATSLDITNDGGYIIAGATLSYSQDVGRYLDGWVIKTDKDGNELWSKTFGYPYHDLFYSVEQTNDGGYILAGFTEMNDHKTSIWIVKIDSEGSQIWERIVSEDVMSFGENIKQTADGGYIVTGVITAGGFIGDIILLKLDENGEIIWSKIFDEGGYEDGRCVQQTNDGGYIIVGYTVKFPAPGDIWLIKTDSTGGMLWNKTFGGSGNDEVWQVQQTIDGGYIMACDTTSYGAGDYDAWIIKTDSNGNEEWNKTFGGKGEESSLYVEQTSDSGYIISGYTGSYGAGKKDAWLIRIAPEDIPPLKPAIDGPTKGKVDKIYTYTASTSDPDGDKLYYLFDWGDGNFSGWLGPYNSGETVNVSYSWSTKGNYEIRVKAKDTYGMESEWSDPLPVSMPRERLMDRVIQELSHFFPHFFSIYWN